MELRPHLLVVDDNQEIRTLLSRFMEKNGFRVTAVRDGREARYAWTYGAFHLVVLDLMLPGENGLEIARWLRDQQDVPIVIVSAMGDDADRIAGLELGADDYIVKPFNPRELLARICAVLRRASERQKNVTGGNRTEQPLRFAGWILERSQRRLLNPDGIGVPITRGEYDLLLAFLEHPNRLVTRDMLHPLSRRDETTLVDRAVDVAVSRLRRKLNHPGEQGQIIKTVRSGGYILAAIVDRI
ncbi:response regulator [Acidisoma cladoniae]|jgi:two-component system OmpR family response regulator|uniref:response regulator n=1 Tax=Acidisoma cladoniae TaxID=3040935 RepID=UPI00254B2B2D|nr:response regulator transcription factor [Acidisoma sp. PAMC 29798]